jgi:hypothetical protein
MNNTKTFKYQKTENESFAIFTGHHNGDTHFIYTDKISFILFKTEKEAKDYCNKLNDITNKANHVWK